MFALDSLSRQGSRPSRENQRLLCWGWLAGRLIGDGHPLAVVVTCAQCREAVLEAELIGDDEECALRDHLLAVHPNTLQPETFGVLLKHFVVTERRPPAA